MNRHTAAVLIAAATLACSAPSAADLVLEVIQTRNNYDAELQSWIVRPDGALYLEVLVVNNNETALRYLTVMVEQLDADNNVLAVDRVSLDVAALTAGLGQNLGVTLPVAEPGVEGVRLFIETNPGEDIWPEFRELDSVRPRI